MTRVDLKDVHGLCDVFVLSMLAPTPALEQDGNVLTDGLPSNLTKY